MLLFLAFSCIRNISRYLLHLIRTTLTALLSPCYPSYLAMLSLSQPPNSHSLPSHPLA